MGGIGSGRFWHWDVKQTTVYYLALDIRRLQRDGLLAPGRGFSWQWSRQDESIGSINIRTETHRVVMSYRHRSGGKDWQDIEYPVRLDHTSCHFGGTRSWFICPAASCGQRVAILYGGAIFACRHCYNLAYPCQRERVDDRATRRADKIRARLNWEPGILNGEGLKPKGMHWRTYEQLSAEHDEFVSRALIAALARFGSLRNGIIG